MKLVGLISVFALIVSLAYAQFKWGPDYTKTFSRLVARKRSSIVYYFIVFFVFLGTFSVFMATDFIPQFGLTGLFTWIYFLGVISQLVCVIVPETGGFNTKIHLIAAGIMSGSVFMQIALLAFMAPLSLPSLVTCVVSLSVMALVLLAIIAKHRLIKYELGLQSLYFVSYLGALMFVSYVA